MQVKVLAINKLRGYTRYIPIHKERSVVMSLTTLYFNRNDGTYAKVIVDVKEVDFFKAMGAEEKIRKVEKKEEVEIEVKQHPDKGSGKPGSLQWHVQCVDELEDRKEVNEYLKKVVGKKILLKGNLSTIKKNAIKKIKEFIEAKNDS